MYKVHPALVPAVYIPGVAYEALIRVRNGLYAAGVFSRRRLPGPVISIGNITMGGSGKTPLAIHIAQILFRMGLTAGILTRGYGRIRPRDMHILPPEQEIFTPAWILGDEPALMRRQLSFAWMGVSKDRFAAGKALAGRKKGMVFLLDDGFQHRKLHRDLDIVVIDRTQPFASNRLFPRGTLREPLSGLRRCDVIMINGPQDPENSVENEIADLMTRAKIFHCRQSISSLVPFVSWRDQPSLKLRRASQNSDEGWHAEPLPASGNAFLVSALGNPGRFRRDTEQLGIRIVGTKFFPDHHRIKTEDWQNCAEAARRDKAETMITTEKDAVKIGRAPDFPLLVAAQKTEIAEAGAFEALLEKIGKERI